MQRHGTLAYIENTITGNVAQRQQAKPQYLGTKAAKQSPGFGTKATNQEPVLSTFCIHTNTFTGSLLSLFLVSSNENLGIKYVSCGLKRSKKFLPSGKLLSLTFVFHSIHSTLANDISIRNVSNSLIC